jgi:hypothetical protein
VLRCLANQLNLIFIGALTSKFYNFSTRPWELVRVKAIDFFDFFTNPVSFHLKGTQIIKVTNFDSKYWISDSIRFLTVAFSVKQSVYPFSRFSNTVTRISWFEGAIAANAALFDFSNLLNAFTKQFFEINFRSSSNLQIFSVGKYVDVKDLAVIRSRKFQEKDSYFYFPYLNGFGSTSTSSRIGIASKTLESNWFSESMLGTRAVKFCFIFSSNLRYENPIFNARIKSLVDKGDLKVYLFGANNSYSFNYKTTYVGGLGSIRKLFAGRLKHISQVFFSNYSFSIFGF